MSISTIARIIQIFRDVLKGEFRIDEAQCALCESFLTKVLRRYPLDLPNTEFAGQDLPPFISKNQSHYAKNPSVQQIPRDFFGDFYTEILEDAEKTRQGIVYTPSWISRKMVIEADSFFSSLINGNKIHYLDPCCGAGVFLLEAFWQVYSRLPPKERTPDAILECLGQIIGIDRDPQACLCCTLNLFLMLVRLDPDLISLLEQRPELIQVRLQDFLMEGLPPGLSSDTPILIIGNPPYIFLRNIAQADKDQLKQQFYSSVHQFDTYGLFFEQAINILPPGGMLSLIVPDSLLTLQNRQGIREILLKSCHILKICRVGNIFPRISVASVIITARKSHNSPQGDQLTQIEDITDPAHPRQLVLSQDSFIHDNFSFGAITEQDGISVIALLRDCAISIELFNKVRQENEQIRIARGIEIGKKGLIARCPQCHLFYPLPARKTSCPSCRKDLLPTGSIFTSVDGTPLLDTQEEKLPIVIGIRRWHCNKTAYVVCNLPGLNYKSARFYSDRRIIIRQLLQEGYLSATFPPPLARTTQSVYNLNLPPQLDPWEMLGVLNSGVTAVALHQVFSGGKKLFPRILLHVLKSLPILPKDAPSPYIREQLRALVMQMLDNPTLDEDAPTRLHLDRMVLAYLGCNPVNQQLILHSIQEFNKVV